MSVVGYHINKLEQQGFVSRPGDQKSPGADQGGAGAAATLHDAAVDSRPGATRQRSFALHGPVPSRRETPSIRA